MRSGQANCLIVAGEKSGEEHMMSFLPQLQELCPQTHFWGVGGETLKQRGAELLYHLKDFSSWGYSGVIKKIPFYLNALKQIEQEVEKRQTKVAILVDFQDFNMHLAKRLKKKGVAVLFYVAPQAWAWKSGRVKSLEKNVHTLFTILPFEKNWFKERGVQRVFSVNHPVWGHYGYLYPQIEQKQVRESSKIKLLLLPGSRSSEVKNLLTEFKDALLRLKEKYSLEVSIVKAGHLDDSLFDVITPYIDQSFSDDELPKALLNADLCLAASGTVTLICALFQVPTVVTYRTGLMNEFLFYTFVNYPGPVSLANIVHEEMVFPELIQEQASGHNMSKHLAHWIENKTDYERIRNKLKKTAALIQGDSNQTAEYMADVIEKAYSS